MLNVRMGERAAAIRRALTPAKLLGGIDALLAFSNIYVHERYGITDLSQDNDYVNLSAGITIVSSIVPPPACPSSAA
jgi:hypothetical protein